jgi:hypothetical protein
MFDLALKERAEATRAANAQRRARTERPRVLADSIDEYRVKSSSGFGREIFGSRDYSTSYYKVQFFESGGKVYVDCECTAGKTEVPCKHIYAAKAVRDEAKRRQTPVFANAEVTITIDRAGRVTVAGQVTDSHLAHSTVSHSRQVSDGKEAWESLQRWVRNLR